MTVETPARPERRQRAGQLVVELQKERGEVWSLYCRIGELKPFTELDAVRTRLTGFSQLLVDYVSLGHFGVYERLLAGTERRNRVLSVAKEIYPEFSATTDAVIAFNDKYENKKVQKMQRFVELEQDLSNLGEALAKRIDMEDRLCELLRHRRP